MSGTSSGNPFVGPRSIQTGETLHGRGTEVFELFNHLQARRVVVLHSPSGAGKSSLVQAGLIPKLQARGFDVWRPVRVNLDPQGLEGVAEGVNRYVLSAMVSLEEELPKEHRRSPAELCGMDLLEYVEGRPRRKSHRERSVVLLFDQFEEVLTAAPRAVEAKRGLFEAVGRVLDTQRYWALFIIREDYLAALAPYRELVPTQLSNTFRLDLLGLDGAREAAEQLALAGGRSFPAVDQLVRDLSKVQVQQPDGSVVAEPGLHVEPVQLQVVCRRLWDAMPEDDRSIDAEDIEAYANVSESLAAYYADAVRAIAGGDRGLERSLREWVGQRLIVGGIRSQVRQGVEQTGGLDNARIDRLLDGYVVRAEQRAGATWFELSHDRLVEPIVQDNERWEREHLHAMQLQARRWEAARRAPEQLLDADGLRDAVKWASENADLLTAGEREYLERSQKVRREQAWARRKRWVWGAAIVAGVLAAGAEGVRRFEVHRRTLACQASGAEIESAWNVERKQALHDGLVATGVSYAPTTAQKVMPWLEAQAQAWSEARVEACMDADVRGLWDAQTLDRSLWCLEEQRMVLQSLVDELTVADVTAVQKAVQAVAGLESVEQCRREAALAVRTPPPPEQREAVRAVRNALARVENLERAGHYETALQEARQVLARAEALGWKPLSAAARLQVGSLLGSTGAYTEAETETEAAYFEAAGGVAPTVAFAAANGLLYTVGDKLARHDDGQRWGRHAEAALVSVEDGEGLRRARLLNNLAAVHQAMGAYEEAKALHERALAIKEKALGADHPDVATSLNNLANVHDAMGAYEEAKALHERALAIREKALGADHPDVAGSLNNLAAVHQSLGAHEEAKALQERALAIKEKALGADHPDVATSLNSLAIVHQAMGAYEEAKALNERALAIWEKALGADHPSVAASLGNLAIVHGAMGRYEEAKALFERALPIFEKALGADHPDVANALNNLAIVHDAMGGYEEAKALYERALAIKEKALGADHPSVASSLGNLAEVYRVTGAYEEARALHERALAIREKALGADHPYVAQSLSNLAELALAQHRPADALPLAERALGIREKAGVPAPVTRFLLAQALWDAPPDAGRDRPRARALAEQARDALRDAGPGSAEDLTKIETWLAEHSTKP